MSKNTGKPYEELTERVFKRLLATQSGVVANVQRDVLLEGRSTKHQIDVTFEFTAGPISYRTIVQCKDWGSPVKQDQILAFNSVLNDIPGQPRGIVVARSGFQRGARNVADHHGIKLYELRESSDEDWDGLIRELVIDMHIRTPRFKNVRPLLDIVAIRAQLGAIGLAHMQFNVQGNPDEMFVKTATNDFVAIRELLNSLVPREGTGAFRLCHKFTDSVVMLTPDAPLSQVPVLGFEAMADVSEFHRVVRVSLDHLIAYSFRDVLTGTIEFLRADGRPLMAGDQRGVSALLHAEDTNDEDELAQ